MRTFTFYSLRKSQLCSLYNTVLSAVVTMLYIRFPDFANLITAACHPFANLSLFPPLFSTWRPLIYSLLLHTCQADLLWETSSCNQGSDLHPVSVCKLSPYSKSVILKPGCVFSVLAVYQNPWWRLKKKSLRMGPRHIDLKISPGDSNVQPELGINVSKAKVCISVLLRGFTPSKAVLQNACS